MLKEIIERLKPTKFVISLILWGAVAVTGAVAWYYQNKEIAVDRVRTIEYRQDVTEAKVNEIIQFNSVLDLKLERQTEKIINHVDQRFQQTNKQIDILVRHGNKIDPAMLMEILELSRQPILIEANRQADLDTLRIGVKRK
jgi:hypothetical protein